MKERPILFSALMVRALLAGTKTQTRRGLKVQPPAIVSSIYRPFVAEPNNWHGYGNDAIHWYGRCPYGAPGDRLWVREAWARDDEDGALMFRADIGINADADAWEQGRIDGVPRYRWRPSIHMPRAASRITLEITGVRVERLQDISESDAVAEGVYDSLHIPGGRFANENYAHLWDTINGDGSWDANQWVWVVEFHRMDAQ